MRKAPKKTLKAASKKSRPQKKKKADPRRNIWMDPDLHVEGVALAKKRNHRSFSELLSFLVRREVDREKATQQAASKPEGFPTPTEP